MTNNLESRDTLTLRGCIIMAVEHGSLFLVLSVVHLILVLSMIRLVAFMLFSLAKKGDERKNFIKVKTMANAFVITLCILNFASTVSLF